MEEYRTNKKILLAILALVFLAPFLRGLVGGVKGMILTVLLFPFLAAFAISVAAIGMLISGVACIVAGIPLTFGETAAGFFTIGIGCILTALGILAFLFLLYICTRWLPRVIYWFTNLYYHLTRKAGKEENER